MENDFLDMTVQYAADVDEVYDTYVAKRDACAKMKDIDCIIQVTEEFKDEVLRLSGEYLKDLKNFKEHPEQQ